MFIFSVYTNLISMVYNGHMDEDEATYTKGERIAAAVCLLGIGFIGFIMLDIAVGGRLTASPRKETNELFTSSQHR
jgi:hypothetical protein